MMRFPVGDILSEQECHNFLMQVLHPDGLKRPNGHPLPLDQVPHDRHLAPIVDCRCRLCGTVFSIFTEQAIIRPQVEGKTRPDATVYTDESHACARIAESGRGYATVCHYLGVGLR